MRAREHASFIIALVVNLTPLFPLFFADETAGGARVVASKLAASPGAHSALGRHLRPYRGANAVMGLAGQPGGEWVRVLARVATCLVTHLNP